MTAATEVVLLVLAILIGVPVAVLATQIIAALPKPAKLKMPDIARSRLAVLVPAHNEETGIEKTLASIFPQLLMKDRLIVVADNCSDATAAVAEAAGAEVTIRIDSSRLGKGYALDHGLNFLEKTGNPEVVVFVDADCQLGEDCLDRIVKLSAYSRRPVQAVYLMTPVTQRRTITSLALFAWRVKNLVRPLGFHRLKFPCQLTGSGMAFPWEIIRAVDLASGHIVEDLKLGLDLALIGKPPLFCPHALVTSTFAAGDKGAQTQRTRWEHGHLETMIEYFPRILVAFCRTRSLSLLAMALDLAVPPLALLALMLAAFDSLGLFLFFTMSITGPLLLAIVASSIFAFSIVVAWWQYGRDLIPFRQLILAPLYAAVKIPLYARFLLNRERKWIRTKRGTE